MSVINKQVYSFRVKGNIRSSYWNLWAFWAIFLLISSCVVLLRARKNPLTVLPIDCIFMCFPLLFKHDVQITVNTNTCTLRYYYLTGWGTLRRKTIDLQTAEGSYKTEWNKGRKKYWQLVIYNHKGWFKKKIAIREGRFSKSQLDSISLLIDECKRK